MTPHPSPIDPAVLGRYLDGTAAPADLGAIEVWVAADLERRAALAALREAWAADARRLAAPYGVDAAWARFAARVGLGAGASPGASARRWGGAGAGRRGAIAAAVVAVLLGGGRCRGRDGRPRRPGRDALTRWRRARRVARQGGRRAGRDAGPPGVRERAPQRGRTTAGPLVRPRHSGR